jgi:hypothetical protein
MDRKDAIRLAIRKAKPKKKRKRNPLATWLRKLTSRLNYGEKVPDLGKCFPKIDTETFLMKYRRQRHGAALNNSLYAKHFKGDETYFFWADHRTTTERILFMLDIDVREDQGTTDGAWRFAELIRSEMLPGLFLEPSTGGKGVHGYVVMKKKDISATRVKTSLNNLQAYVRELAKHVGADIACVEIKGHPPVVKYDDHGNITEITFGQFAKYPRGADVMKTCVVDYKDLAFLDPADIPTRFAQYQDVDDARCARNISTAGIPAADFGPVVAAPSPRTYGSFDPRLIRQTFLDQLPDLERYAARLICQWTGNTNFQADRWTVTARDLAEYFVLMIVMKENYNETLPVDRIRGLWQTAFRAGDFARSFNSCRFAAMRNMLSQHGHIDWIDHRYQNVKDNKGTACKWRLSLILQSTLESFIEGEATSLHTGNTLPDGPHDFHKPEWFNFIAEREKRWWDRAESRLDEIFGAKTAA